MITVFLGAPGAGKGTISNKLREEDGFKHVSTGDLFRYNMKNETELGKLVQKKIDSGILIDDELTFDMLVDALKKLDLKSGKIILDGFPRTIPQADLLADYVKKNHVDFRVVINLDLDKDKIIKRLSSRMFDPETKRTYNKNDLPEGITLDQLIQRKDDLPENIATRFKAYEKDTKPLIDYYSNLDMLVNVSSDSTLKEIKEAVIEALANG